MIHVGDQFQTNCRVCPRSKVIRTMRYRRTGRAAPIFEVAGPVEANRRLIDLHLRYLVDRLGGEPVILQLSPRVFRSARLCHQHARSSHLHGHVLEFV